MEPSVPGDYVTLLEVHVKLNKDFEKAKQSLHDTTRQLKVKDVLLRDYQEEIGVLQNAETSRNLKYESRISSLEDTLANLRTKHLEDISVLESELLKKTNETEDLKIRLEDARRINSTAEKSNTSEKLNELIDLSNEKELLKQQYEELRSAFEQLQIKNIEVEQSLQEYKELTNELRESLKNKSEELQEKSELTDKLYDELLGVTNDLEGYKHTPLQEGSKGNSLFAEVDDRRIHLEKNISHIKSTYVQLKQDHSKHEKLITHLRKENADTRALWKRDLEQIQEDHNEVVDSLRSHLEVLEEISNRQKRQLKERLNPPGDDLSAEYQFYQDMIEAKSSEITKLEKKLSDRSVNEHILSVSLAQAHKELRLLRLNNLDFQKQNQESNEQDDTKNLN